MFYGAADGHGLARVAAENGSRPATAMNPELLSGKAGRAFAEAPLLATFGTEYPIMADLKDGWYLVAHPNGPAIAHSKFDLLASLAHQHEDLPEEVRREAVWQLMRWAANQPTWPKVANDQAHAPRI